MLLAQEYVPDLSEYKDRFMRTPLGLLTQGNVSGAVDELGAAAQGRVQAMMNPETALQTGFDFMGGGLLGTTKLVNKTQMELANEIASKNAETMLGLPKGNTAMDRAKAMGFDVDNPVYHGTSKDIEKFDKRKSSYSKGGDVSKGYFVTDNPNTASMYAGRVLENYPKNFPNVLKLYTNTSKTFDYTNPEHLSRLSNELNKLPSDKFTRFGYPSNAQEWMDDVSKGKWQFIESDPIHSSLRKLGFDSAKVKEGNQTNTQLFKNKNIRSINAAFDPARANEPDLLSGMIALPIGGLLKKPEEKNN
jgi:hypothetical protein